ncbi:hypothetical protein TWF718_010831 [Orbilia javanica]|uniref:Peptidase A1 domain-containing protein n=1 Tax=Orbilia javanica TaxID=47235 RepID=A0AAN8MN00_9PEZI
MTCTHQKNWSWVAVAILVCFMTTTIVALLRYPQPNASEAQAEGPELLERDTGLNPAYLNFGGLVGKASSIKTSGPTGGGNYHLPHTTSRTRSMATTVDTTLGYGAPRPSEHSPNYPIQKIGSGFQNIEISWDSSILKYFVEVDIADTDDGPISKRRTKLVLSNHPSIWVQDENPDMGLQGPRSFDCPCSNKKPEAKHGSRASAADAISSSSESASRPTSTPEINDNAFVKFTFEVPDADLIAPKGRMNLTGKRRMSRLGLGQRVIAGVNVAFADKLIKSEPDTGASSGADIDIKWPEPWLGLGISDGDNNSLLKGMLDSKVIDYLSFGLHLGSIIPNRTYSGAGSVTFGGVDIAKFTPGGMRMFSNTGGSGGSSEPLLDEITIETTSKGGEIRTFDVESHAPYGNATTIKFDFSDPLIHLPKDQTGKFLNGLTDHGIIKLQNWPLESGTGNLKNPSESEIYIEIIDEELSRSSTIIFTFINQFPIRVPLQELLVPESDGKHRLLVVVGAEVILGSPFFR